MRTKTEQLTLDLKKFLCSEGYRPNDRLPVIDKLQEIFSASRVLVQSAVKELKNQGYVTSIDRQGLFMAKRPPSLNKIILAVGHDTDCQNPNIFAEIALKLVIDVENTWQDYDIEVISGVNNINSKDFELLQENFSKGSCAGIILFAVSDQVIKKINFAGVEVFLAAVCPENPVEGVPTVLTDGNLFWEKSYSILNDKGCKDISIMSMAKSLPKLKKYLTEIPLHIEDHNLQGVLEGCELAAINLVKLIFHGRNGSRPDGLIIGDDNLEMAIIKGLIEADITPQKDVKIIVHCNWPKEDISPFAIDYIGFDVVEILDAAVEMIKYQQNHSGKLPNDVRVLPKSAYELETMLV